MTTPLTMKPARIALLLLPLLLAGSTAVAFPHNWQKTQGLAFSPDGGLLTAVKGDNAYVWETGSGRLVATLEDTILDLQFTRDGKALVFASNRNGKQPHETNIFVADWVWRRS
jgi:hypothetical protein